MLDQQFFPFIRVHNSIKIAWYLSSINTYTAGGASPGSRAQGYFLSTFSVISRNFPCLATHLATAGTQNRPKPVLFGKWNVPQRFVSSILAIKIFLSQVNWIIVSAFVSSTTCSPQTGFIIPICFTVRTETSSSASLFCYFLRPTMQVSFLFKCGRFCSRLPLHASFIENVGVYFWSDFQACINRWTFSDTEASETIYSYVLTFGTTRIHWSVILDDLHRMYNI